jgi:hypothetical protein
MMKEGLSEARRGRTFKHYFVADLPRLTAPACLAEKHNWAIGGPAGSHVSLMVSNSFSP